MKKTCRKLGVSFWDFLGDRIGQHGEIAPLPDIIRERAAASRAVTLLAKKSIRVSGEVAEVDPNLCSQCGVCVDICPYAAPTFAQEGLSAGKSEINQVLCKGCGLCVSSCRSGAVNLKGFGTGQIMAMIDEM